MNFVILLNAISYLLVAVFALILCSKLYLKKPLLPYGKIIGLLGLFYLLFAFSQFSHILNIVNLLERDFLLLIVSLLVTTTFLFFYLFYKITKDRHLIYLFLFYIVSLFAFYTAFPSFLAIATFMSCILLLLIFVDVLLYTDFYLNEAACAGIVYAISMALLMGTKLLGTSAEILFWFVPNCALLLMIHFFEIELLTKRKKSKENKRVPQKEWMLLASVLFKLLLFIISFAGFIFLSAIAVHELGHAFVAEYYGCEHTKVILYEQGIFPHTEIICPNNTSTILITISGLIATALLGLLFLLSGQKLVMYISYLLFSFSFLLAYNDLLELGLSLNMVVSLVFFSFILLIFSIISLSIFYLNNQPFFSNRKQ